MMTMKYLLVGMIFLRTYLALREIHPHQTIARTLNGLNPSLSGNTLVLFQMQRFWSTILSTSWYSVRCPADQELAQSPPLH